MSKAVDMAADHFERHLRRNRYPGRGLVVGRPAEARAWMILYWIMGRSQHSQNRRFVAQDGTLRTEPVDPQLVEDPRLIIYEAMLALPGLHLVSNGDQTRTLYEALLSGGTFDQALATREREPDGPNYTPRISGMLDLRRKPGSVTLGILKANLANPTLTDRFTYRPAGPPPGLGYCLTTYEGEGAPLPSFQGEPRLMPCPANATQALDTYWDALDENNRVSLAVKWIPLDGEPSRILVRNRFGD